MDLSLTIRGRAREMGIGSIGLVSLAEARFKVAELRRQLWQGIDPIEERAWLERTLEANRARDLTLGRCAARYIDAHRGGWKNSKHADQGKNTLAMYVSPHFGGFPIGTVDTALVMKALEPVWYQKPEAASRATRIYRQGTRAFNRLLCGKLRVQKSFLWFVKPSPGRRNLRPLRPVTY